MTHKLFSTFSKTLIIRVETFESFTDKPASEAKNSLF